MSSRRFTVTLSKDNFESCLLSFLRATSTIHDNEEAGVSRFAKNKDGSYRLEIVTTTERQLGLPLGPDPLAR